MYDFHYEYIKPKYEDKATLLFTDTDSLCYHIKTEELYKDNYDNKERFDMGDYDFTDEYRKCDKTNAKVVGKMKDETKGTPIVEFVGLRSKCYSILLDNDVEKKTLKGIKKSLLKHNVIKHNDYKRCIAQNAIKTDQRQIATFHNLRTFDHHIYNYKYVKTSLSCYNDKQYILDDGISSLSYGHKDIPTK
jgi:hypothetical protein